MLPYIILSILIRLGSALGAGGKVLEKYGKQVQLSPPTTSSYQEWFDSNRVHSTRNNTNIEDFKTQLRRSLENTTAAYNATFMQQLVEERQQFLEKLNEGQFINDQRRLVEELLDPNYYEKTVHPRRDYTRPTRVNLSMSLYQILDVDEHMQSIEVNVWMVQHWYDEFLDWNPADYGMINRTIVPYHQIWIPDTYLYNSEELEQKKTESLMNAQLETGHWDQKQTGAKVQLMFPAIYKLSCRMDQTIDYWPLSSTVNLGNMARNDEWEVISFEFVRVEESFKCCAAPWVMLYAHLVIRRKPLYYMINLVIPTSIITIVAVTGFFTPTSSSSERDEKLYLGINTLLTMSVMMLMVCNQMPSTSTYVPLMSWYYIGIIMVIVVGTFLATGVLAIHGQKHYNKPISDRIRRLIYNPFVEFFILSPPTSLIDLWTEFGVISEQRHSTNLDPLLIQNMDPITAAKMKALRKNQYRMSMDTSQARSVKKQKMQRRCSLEWEFLANVLDRILLTVFCGFTFAVFVILIGFDSLFTVHTKAAPKTM
ncbi:hypothetical protein GCK72_011652 [Caenorhabditis remanei]|uniref:Uncharacterized protein n=1 Tax=Caenorhabditis remanei TaxID=31234 RepID=A0A6A5H937_CAERE|nr:hypothetical protein GCK72_011652 [Caenorhabditis remanei]KAF1763386.1 hypothetical protein GCK72_011652 [Caenorhabditis remanei]